MSLCRTRAQPRQQRFSYCRFYVSRGHRPRLQVRSGNRGYYFFVGSLSAHPLQQMITDAQRVGYDGEPGIDRATRAKEACIDHVKIIQLVRFAVAIECARLRVVAEPDGAVL